MKYNLENIKNILETEPGKDLLLFLNDELEKLDSITDLDINWNPIHNTIELLSARRAKQRLNNIIKLLTNWSQPVKTIDPRDRFN